jgi:hypothetical protein
VKSLLLACVAVLLASCGGSTENRGDRYVWISPRDVTMGAGVSWRFSADTEESGDDVEWSAGSGWITSDGDYTAPSYAGWDWIQARSRQHPEEFDRVSVKIVD